MGELPPIPDYVRNRIELPTDLPQNLAFLRGWQEVFQRDSVIYNYPLSRAHYQDYVLKLAWALQHLSGEYGVYTGPPSGAVRMAAHLRQNDIS